MKTTKKIWRKPVVQSLSVKGFTLSGSVYAPNEAGGQVNYSPKGTQGSGVS